MSQCLQPSIWDFTIIFKHVFMKSLAEEYLRYVYMVTRLLVPGTLKSPPLGLE